MPALDPSHKRWVECFAARAHRRLRAVGCSTLQLEDVQQECWIAYCKARDTWQEGAGAAFSTYLYGGMRLHLRHWMDAQRMDASIIVKGDDALQAAEAQADTHDAEIALHGARARVLARMSKATRRVVEIVIEPPSWLQEELVAMRAKVLWCRRRGFASKGHTTTSLVMSALGLTAAERVRVMAEMRRFACDPR